MEMHQHISIIIYVSIMIAGLAILLNMVGMYLISKQGPQRTHHNLVILHLSFLQIPISISALVYWISLSIFGTEKNTIIKWTVPLMISSRVPLNLIIAILTADRLMAVKYSLRYMAIVSKHKVKVALIASWLSWVVSFSVLVSMRKEPYRQVLDVFVIPVLDCLLLLFILCTYSYIFWRMRRRSRTLSNISTNAEQMQQGNKRALLVSTIIIFSYIIFVALPDYTDSIMQQFTGSETLEVISLASHLLDTCCYVTLPVTYIYLHKDMRRMFMESVVKCHSRRDERPNMIAIVERRVQIAMI